MTKEDQIAELAGQLGCGDIPGDYDPGKLVDNIAEQVINFGYRKADEVRKETAREILNYLVKSTVIRTAPDTIKMFFKDNYGVEVEDSEEFDGPDTNDPTQFPAWVDDMIGF